MSAATPTQTKICNACREDKALTAFHTCKGGKYGVHPRCKACRRNHYQQNQNGLRAYSKAYYHANKEAAAAYYAARRDARRAYSKARYRARRNAPQEAQNVTP